MNDDAISSKDSPTFLIWLFRGVVALNFLRFALSFSTWFEGSAEAPGFADRLFNPFHGNGFRWDFVWLIFSSGAIFFALFYFLAQIKRDRGAKLNAALCVVWLAAFFIYVLRILHSGLLDLG
jgi:hypothetical protein